MTEMEIKLAYHEKDIRELSGAVQEQQKKIDGMEKTIKLLKDRMKALVEAEGGQDILDEKPPHY